MMSKLHRLQAGVEDGDQVSVDLPIAGGKLIYQAKLGRAPQELVAALNQVLIPVLLMPITFATIVEGDTTMLMGARTHDLAGYARALPRMVKTAVHVTLTPSRDIWADDKYNVPEFTAAADAPDDGPSDTNAKDEESKE